MLYQYVHCTSINKNVKESGLGLVADILHTPVQQSPTFLAPGTGFMEGNFSVDWGRWDSLGMIQAHNIYCALYHYYISSTSYHQTLDPGGLGPLSCVKAQSLSDPQHLTQ